MVTVEDYDAYIAKRKRVPLVLGVALGSAGALELIKGGIRSCGFERSIHIKVLISQVHYITVAGIQARDTAIQR